MADHTTPRTYTVTLARVDEHGIVTRGWIIDEQTSDRIAATLGPPAGEQVFGPDRLAGFAAIAESAPLLLRDGGDAP